MNPQATQRRRIIPARCRCVPPENPIHGVGLFRPAIRRRAGRSEAALAWKHLILAVLLGLALAGCSAPPAQTALPAGPTPIAATPSLVPAAMATAETGGTPTQPPPPTLLPGIEPVAAGPTPAPTAAAPPTSRYRLSVTLDYAAHHLAVEERIAYLNTTSRPLSELVLLVDSQRYPGAFQLKGITWEDGSKAQYQQKDTHLILALRQRLEPGERLDISLSYELQLPQTSKYTNLRPRPFGYTDLQANLGDWYPFVPPYDAGKGWIVHEAAPFGENLVYDIADFEVDIRFDGTQRDLVIAASAPVEKDGDRLRYRLPLARSFAWSASPHYKTAVENVQLPSGQAVTVTSYYFPFYQKAGAQVARTSAQALAVYEEVFGPYPRQSLAAVQADFIDGMEYEGLFFLSKDFYNWYRGGEAELLPAIAAHETAHQWWYGLVGNDQALEPWLDEALCTYAERIYYERRDTQELDWWWTYRVRYFEPRGNIDTTIYDIQGEYESYRNYRDVVYLNGAMFMEELRQLSGDPAFFEFLRDYRERNMYGLATREDFFEILKAHTAVDLSALIEKYFKAP
jgi:hypothetical protein